MANLDEISKAIIKGVKVLTLTKATLDAGVPAKEILDNALAPGIQKVGDLFEKGEYFLPELVMAGDTVTRVLEILEPILAKGDTPHVGKFLIETVKEEAK
jgi:5-methyltetrahydrofolate--homocysteine methyltransferase